MKAQLWKELRRNIHLIIAAGIVLLVPYAIATVVVLLYEPPRALPSRPFSWSVATTIAGNWSLALSMVLAAFVAGNAMAGERADRSAEFEAYLPITRGRAFRSKAIVAIGIMAAVWIANLGVWLLMGGSPAPFKPADYFAAIAFFSCTAALMFGVAWLFSSFARAPGNAAGAGILAVFLLGGTLMLISYVVDAGRAVEEKRLPFAILYIALCCSGGIACFIAGTMHYLRRVEP